VSEEAPVYVRSALCHLVVTLGSQIGHRVEGIVGGLAVEEAETPEPKGGLQ
jgi:hypothetical protein